MNNQPVEQHSDSARQLTGHHLRRWWQSRRRSTKIGLSSGCILLALALVGCLTLFGVAAQQSQSASAASIAHATTTPTPVRLNTKKPPLTPAHPITNKPKCQAVNNNPWCYNFTSGALIYHPYKTFCNYFKCISSFWRATRGYVVECWNGKYSHSGGLKGACWFNKGTRRPLRA